MGHGQFQIKQSRFLSFVRREKIGRQGTFPFPQSFKRSLFVIDIKTGPKKAFIRQYYEFLGRRIGTRE